MENSAPPLERFAALEAFPHAFVGRVPGICVSQDKAGVLQNLDAVHQRARADHRVGRLPFITARQVHGRKIAVLSEAPSDDFCFEGCDGIVTNQAAVVLGIYVADCCAVYLADRRGRAIGLVHSGKKGTELGVTAAAIEALRNAFGVSANDLIVQLSPCIRPPHYEVDFAQQIQEQCRAAGAREIHDHGICTACHLDRYYSYRAEKGRTGRMLAFLALAGETQA